METYIPSNCSFRQVVDEIYVTEERFIDSVNELCGKQYDSFGSAKNGLKKYFILLDKTGTKDIVALRADQTFWKNTVDRYGNGKCFVTGD